MQRAQPKPKNLDRIVCNFCKKSTPEENFWLCDGCSSRGDHAECREIDPPTARFYFCAYCGEHGDTIKGMIIKELEAAGASGLTYNELGTRVAALRINKQPDMAVTMKSVSGEMTRLYTGEVGRQDDGRPLVDRYTVTSCTPEVFLYYLAPEPAIAQPQMHSPAEAAALDQEPYVDEQSPVCAPMQAFRLASPLHEQPSLAQRRAPPNTQAVQMPKQTLVHPRRHSRSQSPRLAGMQTPATAPKPSCGQSAARPTKLQTPGQASRPALLHAQTNRPSHPQRPVQEETAAHEQPPKQTPQQAVLPVPQQTLVSSPASDSRQDPEQTATSLMQSLGSASQQTAVTPQVHSTLQPLLPVQAVTSEQTEAHSMPEPLPSVQAVTCIQTDVQAQPKPPNLAPTSNVMKAQALSSLQTPTSSQAVTPAQNQVRAQVLDAPRSPTLPHATTSTQLGVSPQLPHGSDLPTSQFPAELSKEPQQFCAPRQASEPPGSTDGDELMLEDREDMHTTVSRNAYLQHQANQEALHSDAISPEPQDEHPMHPVLDESGATQQPSVGDGTPWWDAHSDQHDIHPDHALHDAPNDASQDYSTHPCLHNAAAACDMVPHTDNQRPAPQHEPSPVQQLPVGSQHGKPQQQDKPTADQQPAADLQAQHEPSTPTPAMLGPANGERPSDRSPAQYKGILLPRVQGLSASQTEVLLEVAKWLQRGGDVVLCHRPRLPGLHAKGVEEELHSLPKLRGSQATGIANHDQLGGIVSAAETTAGSSQALPEGIAHAEAVLLSASGVVARKRKRGDHPSPASRCQRFCARAHDATQTISRVLVALWVFYMSQSLFKEQTQ